MIRRAGRLAALLAVLAAGCGEDRAQTVAERAPSQRVMRAGARVFAEHCQTCHPLLGRPNADPHSDYVPPLDLDEVQPSAAYVRAMVQSGKIAMGGFTGTPAELDGVVTYVTEVAGGAVTVPSDTSEAELATGRRVYAEHCQRCHVLDGRPATKPNPIWVGTSFDDVRPSVAFAERIVRDGQREAMPSFRDRLSATEIRAVALYLNAEAR